MTDQSSSEEVVKLPSVLSIRDIGEVHARIRNSLYNCERVSLDIPTQASVDLSFLQLVEAARRQAEISGKTIALARPADDSVRSVLERAGFMPFRRPEDARFWFHKENLQ